MKTHENTPWSIDGDRKRYLNFSSLVNVILMVIVFGLVSIILSLRTMLSYSHSECGLQSDTLFGQSEYSSSKHGAAASDSKGSPMDNEDTREQRRVHTYRSG
jgi:hypothetical protein